MKNIILQHWSGNLSLLTKYSMEAYKEYASRIGAEYYMVRGNAFRETGYDAPCQKMCMLNEEFDKYDTVLMVDCDQLPVKGLMKNVFDVPGVGIFTEWIKTHAYARIQKTHPHLFSPNHPYFSGSFYKLDRRTRIEMRSSIVEKEISQFSKMYHDEGIMHRLATLVDLPLEESIIDSSWSQCSYYPITKETKMVHIRPKIEPRNDSPRRPKLDTYDILKLKGIF
jgi:hypothetical protein